MTHNLKAVSPSDWPETLHASRAAIKLPSGIYRGDWQSRHCDDTREYVRADLSNPAAIREAALREAAARFYNMASDALTYDAGLHANQIAEEIIALIDKKND